MSVEYHPAVEQELAEARDFYEKRVPGLGREFIDEFEREVLRLGANPGRYLIVERDVRRALMKRFPYPIYFRQPKPGLVRIMVVVHQRRHPSYGAGRE